MIKLILLATLGLSFTMLKGQVIFKGKFEQLPPEINKMAIDYWSEDRWHELDVVNLAPDKSFQKKSTVVTVRLVCVYGGNPPGGLTLFIQKTLPGIQCLISAV
jgi:hypothetical protein